MLLDFSDMESMEDVVVEVVDCYGCVDVLICNSSMKLKAPVQNISLEIDRNIMDINYFGPSSLAKGESDARFHSLFSVCLFLYFRGISIFAQICDRSASNNDLEKIRTHRSCQQHSGKAGCTIQEFM